MSDNSWITSVDGIPPAGTECEYRSGSLAPWVWCRVVHHSKCATWIVTKSDDRIIRNDLCYFRPIKTERELAIQNALNVISQPEGEKDMLGKLFDAGLLRSKNEAV